MTLEEVVADCEMVTVTFYVGGFFALQYWTPVAMKVAPSGDGGYWISVAAGDVLKMERLS